ncbi:MAG TPA: GWxTD domain-containing protein, partial [Bryobacteraceae bacterium]
MPHLADFLQYWAGISLRSLGLAPVAWAALRICRVRSASARHAVWTVVMIAMLAQAGVGFWLPSIPVRLLRPAISPAAIADTGSPAVLPIPFALLNPAAPPSWPAIVTAMYAVVALGLLGRLILGYFLMRRVLRSSQAVTTPLARGIAKLYESSRISVPVTVGWQAPKILLPIAWRDWDHAKLCAVLAHEEAHVRRADWAIEILARVNACLFWFHPLAWWLRRELALLAEYACDDSALSTLGDRSDYARTLLEMARAVKSAEGRFAWGAVSMAKPGGVQKRIDQILDETRPLSRPLAASGWATLLACALPLAYLVSAVQLAPAQTPPQARSTSATPSASPYDRWLDEEVRWIITDYERVTFRLLQTDDQREQFIEQFWVRRDPTPGTEENEFKEEHYRRIAFANDRFTEAIPGWKTDRGMIYILYGPPDAIDAHAGVPGATYPYESWQYRYIQGMGTDVQFEFVDTTITGR